MDKREYRRRLDMAARPYKYWIEENEPKEYARPVRTEKEQEAMEELSEKYEFFELKEGVRANGFGSRILGRLDGVDYDAVYFDEDVIDTAQSGGMAEALRRFTGRGVLNKRRRSPFFKPDLSPDTLRSFYYPGGLTLISRELAERIAQRGDVYEDEPVNERQKIRYGSAEFLRECLLSAKEVLHIPEVLFHTYEDGDIEYEEIPGEDDTGLGEAGYPEGAGDENDTRHGKDIGDGNDTGDENGNSAITCVILSRDNPDQLKKCIDGLKRNEKAEKITVNIVVVDNGSEEDNRKKTAHLAEDLGFDYTYEKSNFVYSRLNNLGVRRAGEVYGENKYLLFLNDDVEIPEDVRVLKKLVKAAAEPRTGAVGVKLLYPDGDRIQHAGISLLKSGPSHKLNGFSDSREYYHGVNTRDINVLAVTGACLMVRREVFEGAGGFDEAFAVGYTDTELCVKLLSLGYYNVCLNSVALIHHEGMSRGNDLASREALKRLLKERERFYLRFGDFLKGGDPFYSPNLTQTGLGYKVDPDIPGTNVAPVKPEDTDGSREFIITYVTDDDKRFKYALDYCGFELNDEAGNRDFYDIRGWAYIDSGKRYDHEKWLILKRISDGKSFKVKAEDTCRKDVAEAFGKKGIYYAGFEAKIISGELKEGVYAVTLALIKNGTDRGYGREDVCRIETV